MVCENIFLSWYFLYQMFENIRLEFVSITQLFQHSFEICLFIGLYNIKKMIFKSYGIFLWQILKNALFLIKVTFCTFQWFF